MSETEQKIIELTSQIEELKEKERERLRSQILPYIVNRNCALIYRGKCYNSFNIKCPFTLDEILIKLISSTQDVSFNHYGCEIDKDVFIRFDDGELTMFFNFIGKTEEVSKKIIDKCKEIHLKISFSEYKDFLKSKIEKYSEELEDVEKLESEYSI